LTLSVKQTQYYKLVLNNNNTKNYSMLLGGYGVWCNAMASSVTVLEPAI